MGKISQKRKRFEIKQRQKKRIKLKKLKEKYLQASSQEEKEKIAAKIYRINPFINL